MIKESVIGLFSHVDPVVADRYYFRFHGQDVVRISGPWLRGYYSWKALEPPPEAIERFGAKRGRYTELIFTSEEEHQSRPDLITATPPPSSITNPPNPADNVHILLMVPALPTENLLVKHLDPEETSILRWVCAIKYPEGVSAEEGDKWYLEVHAEEAKQQPGLLGFYSYRPLQSSPPPWTRLTEMWYENFAGWRKAILESPPKYTPPPWGGKYPFVEMACNFIDLKPDVDFLRGNYTIP